MRVPRPRRGTEDIANTGEFILQPETPRSAQMVTCGAEAVGEEGERFTGDRSYRHSHSS